MASHANLFMHDTHDTHYISFTHARNPFELRLIMVSHANLFMNDTHDTQCYDFPFALSQVGTAIKYSRMKVGNNSNAKRTDKK